MLLSVKYDKDVISFHALIRQGFCFSFDNDDGAILGYKNGVFIFKAYPCNGVYENVVCMNNLGNGVYNIDSSNSINKSCLWHCCLRHIHKKLIAQL